jgi:hypothetical protein
VETGRDDRIRHLEAALFVPVGTAASSQWVEPLGFVQTDRPARHRCSRSLRAPPCRPSGANWRLSHVHPRAEAARLHAAAPPGPKTAAWTASSLQNGRPPSLRDRKSQTGDMERWLGSQSYLPACYHPTPTLLLSPPDTAAPDADASDRDRGFRCDLAPTPQRFPVEARPWSKNRQKNFHAARGGPFLGHFQPGCGEAVFEGAATSCTTTTCAQRNPLQPVT